MSTHFSQTISFRNRKPTEKGRTYQLGIIQDKIKGLVKTIQKKVALMESFMQSEDADIFIVKQHEVSLDESYVDFLNENHNAKQYMNDDPELLASAERVKEKICKDVDDHKYRYNN